MSLATRVTAAVQAIGADIKALWAALGGKAASAHSHGDGELTGIAWSKVGTRPTTLSGYGITDSVQPTNTNGSMSRILPDTTPLAAWAAAGQRSGMYTYYQGHASGSQDGLPNGWWNIVLLRPEVGAIYSTILAFSATGPADSWYASYTGGAFVLMSPARRAAILTNDTAISTWADTRPAIRLYAVYLSVAQDLLPAGWWYLEFLPHDNNTYHIVRATSLDGTAVYQRACVGGTWGAWRSLTPIMVAPTSAAAAGQMGEIRIDAGFIYVCVATNVWRRAQTLTW